MTTLTDLTPVQQAEFALQVERVLRRMERRFSAHLRIDGAWAGAAGGSCLVAAIDEATPWCSRVWSKRSPAGSPRGCPAPSGRSPASVHASR
jgi:hypothetical protein